MSIQIWKVIVTSQQLHFGIWTPEMRVLPFILVKLKDLQQDKLCPFINIANWKASRDAKFN